MNAQNIPCSTSFSLFPSRLQQFNHSTIQLFNHSHYSYSFSNTSSSPSNHTLPFIVQLSSVPIFILICMSIFYLPSSIFLSKLIVFIFIPILISIYISIVIYISIFIFIYTSKLKLKLKIKLSPVKSNLIKPDPVQSNPVQSSPNSI